jgi:hypothetical protein
MRRLCADREEKRVTRGSDISGQDGEQEQLDLNDPNQRSLLDPLRNPIREAEADNELGNAGLIPHLDRNIVRR